MLEGLITIIGLCITFAPACYFTKYLLNHVKDNTPFDNHIEKVREKKGLFGVIISYSERITLSIVITSMGVLLSTYFENSLFLEIFAISIIAYVILKYIDDKNTK